MPNAESSSTSASLDDVDAASLSVPTIMPHRYQMMLLDRLIEYDPDTPRAVGVKCVGMNDPLVDGHFPERPVFPGALLTEALAQACGALMNMEHLRRNGVDLTRLADPDVTGDDLDLPMTVLIDSKIEHADVALPGDRVRLITHQAFSHGDVRTFQVDATADDVELAEGTIMLAYGHDLDL